VTCYVSVVIVGCWVLVGLMYCVCFFFASLGDVEDLWLGGEYW